LLAGSFSDNRKHKPEGGGRRKKASPYGITWDKNKGLNLKPWLLLPLFLPPTEKWVKRNEESECISCCHQRAARCLLCNWKTRKKKKKPAQRHRGGGI